MREPARIDRMIDAIAKVLAMAMVLWIEMLAVAIAALWLWGVL